MIKGFDSYDDVRRLVSMCQAKGMLWKSDSKPASMAEKYRPKRTPKEEYAHQRKQFASATEEYKKTKEGTAKWKRCKIRVSVIRRLRDLAKLKVDAIKNGF